MYLSYLDNKYNLVYNVCMTSDLRVVRFSEDSVNFNIHEVFFDEHGIPTHMNEEPISMSSTSITDLTQKLIIIISALTKPIIDPSIFNSDHADKQQEAMDIFKNV